MRRAIGPRSALREYAPSLSLLPPSRFSYTDSRVATSYLLMANERGDVVGVILHVTQTHEAWPGELCGRANRYKGGRAWQRPPLKRGIHYSSAMKPVFTYKPSECIRERATAYNVTTPNGRPLGYRFYI